MEIRADNELNQRPRVTIDEVSHLDPHHPQIEIRYENIPGGWVVVVQMLYGALGAALPQAFAQIQQQGAKAQKENSLVLVPGMNHLRR